jgi:hypothetical protein
MDSIGFASWMAVIRRLDASQRGRAFQELTLAEANIPVAASADAATVSEAKSEETEVVPSVARESTAKAAPDQDLLSQIGQGHLASFGCPHCGGDDIRPWGKARDKQASVPLRELPEDLQSTDRDTAGWITLSGSLAAAGAGLD